MRAMPSRRPAPLRWIAGLALAGCLVAACREKAAEPALPAAVQTAWEEFRADPNGNTFLRFRVANRDAAFRHGNPHDAVGVLHQLLALEAEAEMAERGRDLQLADGVVTRVAEIEEGEVIDVYEELVPGARDRLRAARARVEGMLE